MWDAKRSKANGSAAEVHEPIVCYVTDRRALCESRLGEDAADAIIGRIRGAMQAGADWVQIREKDLAGGQLFAAVRRTVNEAKETEKVGRGGAAIHVNDRLDIALAAGAAGVHLGSDSLPVGETVQWRRNGNVPSEFTIGASCHGVESATEAEKDGADYIFFGPIFDTPSKKSFGPPQGVERLREICRTVRIPVLAIGGVNETNAESCIREGAAGIAAIRLFQGKLNPEQLSEFIRRLKTTRR